MLTPTRPKRWWMIAGILLMAVLFTGFLTRAAAQPNPEDEPITWLFNARANSDYPPAPQYSQHEPHLAISRTNPDVVVAVAKDYRRNDNKEVWIYVSHDGGLTWPIEWQRQIPGIPPEIENQSDPVAMARDDGRIYVLALGHEGGHGLFITWSDDDGLTWQDPSIRITYNETPFGLDDKEWLAIDNIPSSPYYHNMYVAWATGGIQHKRSTDGGLTWSTPYQTIAPGSTEYPFPVVAPDGDLYVFYMDGWGYCADGYIRYVKSTDGGVSFTGPYTVIATSQPCSPIHGGGFDLFRFFSIITAAADPTNPDNLWVAWTDDNGTTYGKTDVLYVRSTDGGAVWSVPARLSHDDPGAFIDHITPVFAMSEEGRLHAFWLDRRLDPQNRLWHGYHTSTLDGITWEPDTQVSMQAFDLNLYFPPPTGYNAAGDYWGLDVSGGYVMAAWNTTVESSQDIYVARGSYALPVTLTGQVRDAASLLPIQGAQVLADSGQHVQTGTGGIYTMTLLSGIYTMTASAEAYFPLIVPGVEVLTGTVVLDFELTAWPLTATLAGQVRDVLSLLPIQGAQVLLDTGAYTYTDAGGAYSLEVSPGYYTATAQASGYYSQTIANIEVLTGTVTADFSLPPLPCPLPQILDVSLSIADLSVAFSPTLSATLPVEYLWSFGDGITSTLSAPQHTYPAYGSYTYSLDVTNACGVDAWSADLLLRRFLFLPVVQK